MNKRNEVICSDIDGNKHKVSADKLSFRPSAYGIIIKENKILLLNQWNGYNFPGGGVNLGETIQEALEREVWEETGFKTKNHKIIECVDSFFLVPFEKITVQSILMFFLSEIKSGEISDKNFDEFEKKYAKKAEWIEIEKAKKSKIYISANSGGIIEKACMMNGKK